MMRCIPRGETSECEFRSRDFYSAAPETIRTLSLGKEESAENAFAPTVIRSQQEFCNAFWLVTIAIAPWAMQKRRVGTAPSAIF